jgi:hypothetical protein
MLASDWQDDLEHALRAEMRAELYKYTNTCIHRHSCRQQQQNKRRKQYHCMHVHPAALWLRLAQDRWRELLCVCMDVCMLLTLGFLSLHIMLLKSGFVHVKRRQIKTQTHAYGHAQTNNDAHISHTLATPVHGQSLNAHPDSRCPFQRQTHLEERSKPVQL